MDTRRAMLLDAWAQLLLVLAIVVLANTLAARSFGRLDLTQDKIYSLDIRSREIMARLERPLAARVYFTGGLQAPYNSNQQVVVDTLNDLAAYARGQMEISVVDPTGVPELEAEARRFGITPIQYRFDSATVKELRTVYMGVALVYGERQDVLPAITQTQTLEYDLVRSIRGLLDRDKRRVVGWTSGHGEPELTQESGPLATLRQRLLERYDLRVVPLGGAGSVPEDVSALLVVGPQRPLSERALYQLDQHLMRGGGLAVFLSNLKPDLRTMRPLRVLHGMEGLLAHHHVKANRDLVIDRQRNGMMNLPVRQGDQLALVPVNTPLIPRTQELDRDNLVVRDLDSMLFPFVSSVELADPLPPEVVGTVLARSHEGSGRLAGLRTLAPEALRMTLSSEQTGSFPLLVSLRGSFQSFYSQAAPPEPDPTMAASSESPVEAPQIRSGADARLVVAGSADFVPNHVVFMQNLVDWMVEDGSLIAIRSKSVQQPTLRPLAEGELGRTRALIVGGGLVPLALLGLLRLVGRRRFASFHQGGEEKRP
jgi:ABC-type uncharacterized transport system involved in gliding motility auxiliary subunit